MANGSKHHHDTKYYNWARILTLVATHTSLPIYTRLYHAHIFVSLLLLLGVINTAVAQQGRCWRIIQIEAKPETNTGLAELEQLTSLKGTPRRRRISRGFKRERLAYQRIGKADGKLKYFCHNTYDYDTKVKCEGMGTLSCHQTILLESPTTQYPEIAHTSIIQRLAHSYNNNHHLT